MPFIPILIFGGGALTGFLFGQGASGMSNLIKYGIIGFGLYLGGKHFKLI